jgi:predicted GIY-YIG superfamily endonuclease
MRTYYIYILASKRNGTLYVGFTNNLKRRIYEHKNGIIGGFTKNIASITLFILKKVPMFMLPSVVKNKLRVGEEIKKLL